MNLHYQIFISNNIISFCLSYNQITVQYDFIIMRMPTWLTAEIHVSQHHGLEEAGDVKLDFPGLDGLSDQVRHTPHSQHAGLMDFPPKYRIICIEYIRHFICSCQILSMKEWIRPTLYMQENTLK